MVLATWGPLRFHLNVRMNFSISVKKKKGTGIIQPFKVYNSMLTSIFTDLCNSHAIWSQNTFILPKRSPYISAVTPVGPKQPSVYFLSGFTYSRHFLFLINSGTIQYIIFCDWLLSLRCNAFKVQPCCRMYQYIVTCYDWVMLHCVDTPHFVYSSVSEHLLLWIMVLWTVVYKFFMWTYVFTSLGYIPWSGIAVSYGHLMCTLLVYLSI